MAQKSTRDQIEVGCARVLKTSGCLDIFKLIFITLKSMYIAPAVLSLKQITSLVNSVFMLVYVFDVKLYI